MYVITGKLRLKAETGRICINYFSPNRVEIWWIFVRNAVRSGEKNKFHRVFLTSFCGEYVLNFVLNYLFSRRSQYSYKKESSPHSFEPLTSCMTSTLLSTAPTVPYNFAISGEFKSDWVNFGNHILWKS